MQFQENKLLKNALKIHIKTLKNTQRKIHFQEYTFKITVLEEEEKQFLKKRKTLKSSLLVRSCLPNHF